MKRILLLVTGLCLCAAASAQIRIGEKGQLTGSLESNSIYYVEDDEIGEDPVNDFGTHNYLKLDYTYGRLSAGVQGDFYMPLAGYEDLTTENKAILSSKYIQWQDKNFEALVGDVYDQFGNGLVYRSFEDRQLGLNNGIEGARAIVRYNNYFQLKGIFGRPRLGTSYVDHAWITGADLSLSLSDMFGMDETLLSVEGSFVNRMQNLHQDEFIDFAEMGLDKHSLQLYSARANFGWKSLSLGVEYATKGKDLSASAMDASRGSAFLGQAAYSHKGFSAMATFRRLEEMGTRLSLYNVSVNNTLNYLPALTRQYTYMLANLNPYQVNTNGEVGGQLDLSYSMRSTENRYRYWNFHANYSTYYTTDNVVTASGDRELMWRDFNFDVERQWNKKWKTLFLYSFQEWSPSHGYEHRTYVSNIFVADITYKINRKNSIRLEAQYLLSDEYEGDWVGGLIEYSLAPHWSIFFSDMYNIDLTKVNYYNGGFSYSYGRIRAQLSYGRNRAGYICSGGVCRYSPAYTGANLMVTASF